MFGVWNSIVWYKTKIKYEPLLLYNSFFFDPDSIWISLDDDDDEKLDGRRISIVFIKQSSFFEKLYWTILRSSNEGFNQTAMNLVTVYLKLKPANFFYIYNNYIKERERRTYYFINYLLHESRLNKNIQNKFRLYAFHHRFRNVDDLKPYSTL